MATIHQDQGWAGKSLTLVTGGKYDSKYLKSKGFINNAGNSVLSSYTVADGYIMQIFKGGDFNGETENRTDRNRQMTGSYNNNIRSIRILKRLVSNEHFLLDTDNNNYLLLLLLIICLFFACRN